MTYNYRPGSSYMNPTRDDETEPGLNLGQNGIQRDSDKESYFDQNIVIQKREIRQWFE